MPGEVTFLPLTRLQQPHAKYPNTRVRYTHVHVHMYMYRCANIDVGVTAEP